MSDAALDQRIAAMRRFNRFYTQRIGVLHEALLDSPFSLAESRVMYELGQRRRPTATELGRELGLDAGYLSRILRGFEKRGLLERTPSDVDGRQQLLSLTEAGQAAFAALDAASRKEIGDLLDTLPTTAQRRLVEAMRTIERALGAAPDHATFVLRPPRPGDIGWVVRQHGLAYA
jgi:DNA-binding MarR family transcriptional regulator